LYYIREIKEKKMVRSVPDFPVYVDSPLAREATHIFSGDLQGYTDDETTALVQQGINILAFDGLRLTQTTEESKLLNQDPTPKVILSASGMCDAGRIRHHLKHNLWREECTVVFVGFQAVGSLGRILTDKADRVKLFGEEIVVRANIVQLHGLSSHADRTALLRWINTYSPKPQHVFLVHGEAEVATAFGETLRQAGFSAHAPDFTEVYDLAANALVQAGVPFIEKKKSAGKDSPVYQRLWAMGQQLLEVIRHNRGGANKDLGKFADQIKALIDKWDR